ncbi:hypothetical protein RB595_005182 [Gaeumannomyces hyphopodioides]
MFFFGGGKSFSPDRDIPDLSGRVVLVTGANIGLGQETVLQACKHGPARVFLCARSEAAAHAAIEDIEREVPGSHKLITFVQLDLASFASIKGAAASVLAQTDRLDVLCNNAGIMGTAPALTADGYELQLGVNHVGHALLTRLLLPLLLRTAEAGGGGADVRVVNLASEGERLSPADPWAAGTLPTYKTPQADRWAFGRYGASKLANIHHARCLARRHPSITAVAVHPGAVATGLTRGPKESYPWIGRLLELIAPWVTPGPRKGALNQLWACFGEGVVSGEYYTPVAVTGKGSAMAYDDNMAERLWEWTEKELDACA